MNEMTDDELRYHMRQDHDASELFLSEITSSNLRIHHDTIHNQSHPSIEHDPIHTYFHKMFETLPVSTAETLLLEWFRWWETSDSAPAKMPESLHMKTAIYFVEKKHSADKVMRHGY